MDFYKTSQDIFHWVQINNSYCGFLRRQSNETLLGIHVFLWKFYLKKCVSKYIFKILKHVLIFFHILQLLEFTTTQAIRWSHKIDHSFLFPYVCSLLLYLEHLMLQYYLFWGSCLWGNFALNENHLTLMFQWRAPCETICGHEKKCVWNTTFLLGPISLKNIMFPFTQD